MPHQKYCFGSALVLCTLLTVKQSCTVNSFNQAEKQDNAIHMCCIMKNPEAGIGGTSYGSDSAFSTSPFTSSIPYAD